ncbi:MAG: NUDIX hydrolase [Clostridiales bacterium]|nr:NUDIX hydrolase [Clostridiales bacterium]
MNEPVNEKGQTLSEFLAGYDMTKYDRPSVTADNIVMANIGGRPAVLLIRRRNHPFIGCLAFPGGFLERGESPEDGAKRELFEETAVEGVTPVQLGAYGRPGRDPRGWIITIAFISELPEGQIPQAGDDAKDAGLYFVSIDSENETIILESERTGEIVPVPYSFKDGRAEFIPTDAVAGDHSQILADALHKLGMI